MGLVFTQADIDRDTTVSADIENDLMQISARTAFWGAVLAERTEAYLNAEHQRKLVESREFLKFKAKEGDGKRMTVDELASKVKETSDYNDARVTEIKAEASMMKARAVCDAMRAKREALMTLGNFRIQEMKSDPALRDDHAKLKRSRENMGDLNEVFADPNRAG